LTSCAQEERAARLVNAFVTKVQLNADGSTTSFVMPNEVGCGDKRYLIEDGEFKATVANGVVDGKYLVTSDMSLTLVKAQEGFAASKLTCKVSARWKFNEELLQFRGGGAIESCDDFSCSIGMQKLDCGKMKAALAQFKCNE